MKSYKRIIVLLLSGMILFPVLINLIKNKQINKKEQINHTVREISFKNGDNKKQQIDPIFQKIDTDRKELFCFDIDWEKAETILKREITKETKIADTSMTAYTLGEEENIHYAAAYYVTLWRWDFENSQGFVRFLIDNGTKRIYSINICHEEKKICNKFLLTAAKLITDNWSSCSKKEIKAILNQEEDIDESIDNMRFEGFFVKEQNLFYYNIECIGQ